MIMKGQNVGSVPVISDRNSGHVIGIITDRDIALRVVAEQREYYHTHVGDVMSKDVVTCKMDDDYDEVIAAMKENQIHRIPVVDSTKRLVGIIALADVAREAKPKTVGETVEEISQRSGERERES
jgi:CBS domain-containing protein